MTDSTSKVCARCGLLKPQDDYYRRSIAADGLGSTCKNCLAARRRERAAMTIGERTVERDAITQRVDKYCTQCDTVKPRAEFRARSGVRDGLVASCRSCESTWQRTWYQENRDLRRDQAREWYEANRESRRAVAQKWYEANRESQAEYQRARARANPEERARLVREWRKKNPDRSRELSRAWVSANRERIREQGRERTNRRRALKAGTAVGEIDTSALWTGACGICASTLDPVLQWPDPMSKSIDHIRPLSRGGAHVQENLQWAHLFCNISKGAKVPH